MNHQSTDNKHIRKVFTRRAFLGRAAKSALQLTLTGQLLLSKKALAGAYAGQSSTSDKLAVASLIGVLPIYLTAIFAQKWLVRGLTTGAGR